jgi:DNA-binding transcriptional MerR regulator
VGWRIKTVVERTGVPADTLRSWERRYAVVVPERSESGYRQYSDADIARLIRVKEGVDSGLAVSEAILRCQDEEPPPPPPRAPEPAAPLRAARQRLLQALLDLDAAAADAQVARLGALPLPGLVGDVLLPVGREASFLRAQGQCAPGEVAFARGWLRDRLAALRVPLGDGPPSAPTALVLRLPGGSELAQQGLAIGLRLLGWRTCFVGAALPLIDAAPLLQRLAPRAVLVCVDPTAPPAEQRTDLGRLEALAPSASLLVHGAAAAAGRALPLFDLAELPAP